jgi:CHASE3 domain sensor protein
MLRSLYLKITLPFILLIVVSMIVLGFVLVNTERNSQLNTPRII